MRHMEIVKRPFLPPSGVMGNIYISSKKKANLLAIDKMISVIQFLYYSIYTFCTFCTCKTCKKCTPYYTVYYKCNTPSLHLYFLQYG